MLVDFVSMFNFLSSCLLILYQHLKLVHISYYISRINLLCTLHISKDTIEVLTCIFPSSLTFPWSRIQHLCDRFTKHMQKITIWEINISFGLHRFNFVQYIQFVFPILFLHLQLFSLLNYMHDFNLKSFIIITFVF